MRTKNQDKTAAARKIADGALGLFAAAHAEITRAITLLKEATEEHSVKAAEHLAQAGEARSLIDAHQASADKLAEFLPGQGA